MVQKSTKVSLEEAEQNAAEIEKLWQLGKNSILRCPAKSLHYRSTKKTLKKELALLIAEAKLQGVELKISRLSMYRIRKLETYKEEEITALARRIRHRRSRFSSTHLFRIIALTNTKIRDRLEKDAVRFSWTLAELVRRMRLADKRTRKPGSGRKTRVPRAGKPRLMDLGKLTTKWLRWTKKAFQKNKPISKTMGEKIYSLVRKADSAVKKLQKELDKRFNIDRTPGD